MSEAGRTPLKLVVFDMDGTLVDSQGHIVEAMQAAFATHGHTPPPAKAVRDIVGLPLLGAIAQLAPEGTGDTDHLRMAEVYKETYHAKRTGGAVEPLMVGAKAAVERLDAAGYLLGVATGKGRRGMVGVLESHGLISRFVSLKCGDDGPGKPNPHMLRTVMDEAGARPEDTVMIGDTTFDLIMARAADVPSIAVTWGYHPPPVLASEKPGRTVDRFEDVFDAVGALIGPA